MRLYADTGWREYETGRFVRAEPDRQTRHGQKAMRPLCSLIVFAIAVNASAQQPRFDVTSVKINHSGETATSLGFQRGGRFRAVNEPLWRLIAEAYGTKYQL